MLHHLDRRHLFQPRRVSNLTLQPQTTTSSTRMDSSRSTGGQRRCARCGGVSWGCHTCARLCWRGKVISPSQAPQSQTRTSGQNRSSVSEVVVSRCQSSLSGHDLAAAYLSRFSIHFLFRPTIFWFLFALPCLIWGRVQPLRTR